MQTARIRHTSVLLERSSYAPQLAGIRQISNVQIHGDELIDRWLPALAERLGVRLRAAELSEAETASVRQTVHEKFANARWTFRR